MLRLQSRRNHPFFIDGASDLVVTRSEALSFTSFPTSMNPDGSSPTRLTDDTSRGKKLPHFSPVSDSNPVWSPDGTKIAIH